MFKGSISAGLGSLTNVGFEGHSDIEACCSWAADIGHSDGGSGSFCGKREGKYVLAQTGLSRQEIKSGSLFDTIEASIPVMLASIVSKKDAITPS